MTNHRISLCSLLIAMLLMAASSTTFDSGSRWMFGAPFKTGAALGTDSTILLWDGGGTRPPCAPPQICKI